MQTNKQNINGPQKQEKKKIEWKEKEKERINENRVNPADDQRLRLEDAVDPSNDIRRPDRMDLETIPIRPFLSLTATIPITPSFQNSNYLRSPLKSLTP